MIKAKFLAPTVFVLFILGLFSCHAIFKGVVAPNRCQRCELLNSRTNEVLWTVEGCGSDNVRLEEKCQLEGWALSRGGFNSICDMDVRCETWKKEE